MLIDADLLEESFDLVVLRGDDLAAGFYRRLFASAPSLLPLFSGVAMDRQQHKFLSTLVILRRSWRDMGEVLSELEWLGGDHLRYGVLPDHYPLLGDALIETMIEIGGSRWKPEYTISWRAAYAVVAEAMLRGAASAPPPNADVSSR